MTTISVNVESRRTKKRDLATNVQHSDPQATCSTRDAKSLEQFAKECESYPRLEPHNFHKRFAGTLEF